ncbi:MAG: ead/Ea22-like family protein [Enterobacter hormaechei]|nr:ead/Ea22-like family protein [Enterobacter hormaechei]MDU4341291.1 ead/Ea22-like family protein [Enterobacter hormaechei]
MTNISAVIAELMEKVEVNSPRIASLHYCLSEAAKRIAELEQNLAESEARCSALAAENAGLKDEISNITFMRDDDFFGSTQRAQEVMGRLVNVKTPATNAFLAEVLAQAHKEGAHFVANRMLAAWEAGFIDDTAKNAADIARMILTSTEFMADAPEGDFDRSFADGVLEDIAAQLRKGVQS